VQKIFVLEPTLVINHPCI